MLVRAEGGPVQQKGPADLMELREGIQSHWPQTSSVDAHMMSNDQVNIGPGCSKAQRGLRAEYLLCFGL